MSGSTCDRDVDKSGLLPTVEWFGFKMNSVSLRNSIVEMFLMKLKIRSLPIVAQWSWGVGLFEPLLG